MSSLPLIPPHKTDSERLLEIVVQGSSFVLLGPVVLLLSALVYAYSEEQERGRGKVLLGILSLGSLLYLWFGRFIYHELVAQELFHNPLGVVLMLWLLAPPLIPLGAVCMGLWKKLSEWLTPGTLEDMLKNEERTIERYETRLSSQAQKRVKKEPRSASEVLYLGPVMKGDFPPDYVGIHRSGSWIGFEEGVLNQHLFILGASGAGKSETIKRLCYEVLTKTERDLFIVDGKGEEELASDIRSLVYATRGIDAPVFRLGQKQTGAIYNGFQGDREDILNRLLALIRVGEASGNAEYYADLNRNLLQLICYAPGGPPRSFEDLQSRLSLRWLKNAWKGNEFESEQLSDLKPEQFQGLVLRLLPLIRAFQPLVGPEGFSLEDTQAAIFSIRTQSVSDTASRFVQFLVEDLKDFAGKRQERPAVFIIDEFAAFGNQNIIDLLALARSAQLGIVLATQDTAGLQDETTKQLILANTRTKLLMASDFPEEVAKLAGTIRRIEHSVQFEDGQPTGMGSARVQDQFRIDMNEVSRLRPGEAFLFRQRYALKVRVAQVENIPAAPPEREFHRDTAGSIDEPDSRPQSDNRSKGSSAVDLFDPPST